MRSNQDGIDFLGLSIFTVHGIDEDGLCTCVARKPRLKLKKKNCDHPGKHPVKPGWQEKAFEAHNMPRDFPEAYDYNVGIRTGVEFQPGKKVIVVEGDGEAGCQWIESFPGAEKTRTNVTKRGKHYLFLVPSEVRISNSTNIVPGVEQIDVRGEGGFIVGPGSTHHSGHVYGWGNDNPIAPLPDDLLKHIIQRQDSVEKLTSNVTEKYLQGHPSSGMIKVGTRHDVLLRVAASLRSRGYDEEYITTATRTLNETSCEEPIGDKEINGLIDYALRIEPNRSPVSDEVKRALRGLKEAYSKFSFKRPFTKSDKAIIFALIDQAMVLGEEVSGGFGKGIKAGMSRRVHAEKANLSRSTVQSRITDFLVPKGIFSTGRDSKNQSDSGFLILNYTVVDQETGEILLDLEQLRESSEEITIPVQDKNKDIEEKKGASYVPELLPSPTLVKDLRNGAGRIGKSAGEVLDHVLDSGQPRSRKEIAMSMGIDTMNKSSMSSLSRSLRKLRQDKKLIIKDEKTGKFYRPDDYDDLIEEDRREHGEFAAADKQKADHEQQRIEHKYWLKLRKAARDGRDLEEVPVPEGVRKSRGVEILEKEQQKLLAQEEISEEIRRFSMSSGKTPELQTGAELSI